MIIHDGGYYGMSMLWIRNIPVYGARILFGPTRKPNDKTYILWIDSIHLTDSSCYIHGPFNFDSHSDIIKPKQYIALSHWEFLLATCSTLGIVLLLSLLLQITNPLKRHLKII